MCETFPSVATDSLVFLPRFDELLFFFFYCKTFFFFLFTAKAYLICAVPPQTPYLLPDPLLPPPCSCLLIKLPLVALESRRIFNESALKWLVTCDSKYILQSKPFLKVLHTRFRMGVFASHIQGEVFLPALCYTVSIHSSHSCRQPVSLPQFVGLAIDMLNMKYLTFPCEHIFEKDMDCCFKFVSILS